MSLFGRWRKRFRRWRNPLGNIRAEGWLADTKASALPVVAIANPEWRGVYSSTVNLLPVVLPVLDGLVPRSARRIADLVAQTGASRVVISGLPASYEHLIEALAEKRLPVYVLWYGNFMQSGASGEWQSFCALKRLAREGRIRKIGFAKTGMAEVFQRLGMPASFVVNAIDRPASAPSTPEPCGPHLGIAAVSLKLWRKLPFAMLAACSEIPNSVTHLVGADDRVIEFVQQLQIDARITRGSIPQSEMPQWLAGKHLNLYVTLSECCPMLPLESLAVGVPCLVGPTSHLFSDDPYLHSRLVVPYPERHEVIAAYARQALAERDQIIAAYARWQPGYVRQSRKSVAEFLDLPEDAVENSPWRGSHRLDPVQAEPRRPVQAAMTGRPRVPA